MAATMTSDSTTDPESRPERAARYVDDQLDRIERGLPSVPAAVFRLQRAVAERMVDQGRRGVCALGRAVSTTTNVARIASRTVGGTARYSAEQTASAARTGARRTYGQARAQRTITASAAREAGSELTDQLSEIGTEAVEVVRDTIDHAAATVAPAVHGTAVAYGHWSKRDLYDLARDRDIAGRSTMSRAELVDAIEAQTVESQR